MFEVRSRSMLSFQVCRSNALVVALVLEGQIRQGVAQATNCLVGLVVHVDQQGYVHQASGLLRDRFHLAREAHHDKVSMLSRGQGDLPRNVDLRNGGGLRVNAFYRAFSGARITSRSLLLRGVG